MSAGSSSWGSGGGGGGDGDAEDEEQEEDHEDDFEETRWMNKDSILFVIDCSEPMLQPSVDGGEAPLRCALRGASRVYQNKIIAGVDDLVGVVFVGATTTKNNHGVDGLHILQELGVPDAPGVTLLDQLIDDTKFNNAIGHAQQLPPLEKVLWSCSMLFSKCAIKVGSKRIFLFTNTDDPDQADPHAQAAAKRRALDMSELGIEIELFSMNQPGHKFDLAKFYANILALDEDDMTARYPAGADKLEQIFDQLRKKEYKKRTMARLPFWLTDNMEIAVRVFNLLGEAKKGSYTYMDPHAQNAEVKPLTKFVADGTGTILSRKELHLYQDFGGERVVFDLDEMARLKNAGDPGLVLMGFKPRSAVHRKHFVHSGTFIYPNESDVKGSAYVFNALIESMTKKDVVAICRMIARTHSLPRFVALFPQREEISSDGVQVKPPGMHVIPLPFNDDIRKLKREPVNKASDDHVKLMQTVVKKLTMKTWVPVENPALQRHYQTLQLIALNQDVPEEIPDGTEPEVDKMKQRAGQAIEEFWSASFPDGYKSEMLSGSTASRSTAAKRKAAASASADGDADAEGGRAKKVKPAPSADDVKRAVADGTVKKLTVAELKDFLKGVGVKTTSTDKKDSLVEKVVNYYK